MLRLTTHHLRDPKTPGNRVEPPGKPFSLRFTESAARPDRFHRVCAMSREIVERCADVADRRRDIAFCTEVRVWTVKIDAAERATGPARTCPRTGSPANRSAPSLRTRIRRGLAKYDYPPEEECQAVDLVIRQMETLAAQWAPGT